MSFDYSALAKSRLISQYRNDEKMKTFLTLLGNLINTEFEVANDVRRLLYSIDDMAGAQLDLIGRVLVQERPYVVSEDLVFFGYEGTPGAVGYDVAPYANFDTISDITVLLPDEPYKKLLKAKAAKNNTDCSIDDIIMSAQIITGDPDISLTNGQDMTFALVLSLTPDAYTEIMLDNFDIIPAPAGVEFTGWTVAA